MNDLAIQRTRSQLQARIRRLKTCPVTLFPSACRQFLAWVDSNLLLKSIRERIADEVKQLRPKLEIALDDDARDRVEGPIEVDTLRASSALALAALEVAARAPAPDPQQDRYLGNGLSPLSALAFIIVGDNSEVANTERSVERIRDTAVETAYEYFDEELDARNTVIALLLKYAQRCEWYRRHRMREMAQNGHEGRDGERAVVFDLYEYLHDHGVDFWIESRTASGEPDLVMDYHAGQRVVVDGKLIRERSEAKRTAVKGFRQVFDYCRDHQEPVGYLAVFISDDLIVEVDGSVDDAFRCLRLEGTTIYYVMIDIAGHSGTASKRPPPNVVRLSASDVMNFVPTEES